MEFQGGSSPARHRSGARRPDPPESFLEGVLLKQESAIVKGPAAVIRDSSRLFGVPSVPPHVQRFSGLPSTLSRPGWCLDCCSLLSEWLELSGDDVSVHDMAM